MINGSILHLGIVDLSFYTSIPLGEFWLQKIKLELEDWLSLVLSLVPLKNYIYLFVWVYKILVWVYKILALNQHHTYALQDLHEISACI